MRELGEGQRIFNRIVGIKLKVVLEPAVKVLNKGVSVGGDVRYITAHGLVLLVILRYKPYLTGHSFKEDYTYFIFK